MRSLTDHILALQQSEFTDATAAEIADVFSDEAFLQLPLDQQYSFLDFVEPIYVTTNHGSAPQLAAAVQKVFQAHLSQGQTRLARLYKTYDFLYLLYWCAATSIEQQREFDAGVVIPFSRYLAAQVRSALPPSGAPRKRRDPRIRLCYMAEFAYDSGGNALALVADTVLASLSEHCASEYELFLYAWRYNDPKFIERIQALGVTVRTFDLSEYSEKELQRMRESFREDHIDIVLTDMNSAVPQDLFHRRVAPVQIFYQLGMPFWQARNVDAVFQGWQIAPETLGFTAEQCHLVHAPRSARFIPAPDWEAIQAERNLFPASKHTIGFYGRLIKITPAQCGLFHRILQRHPDTIAVLGGTGDAGPIRDFISEHQLEERMFVMNRFVDGHVWGRFLDVFLDTFPLTGGYSCREVVAKGKPVVHMLSEDMPNLNVFLDPELQASQPDAYVEHVSRLLDDPAFYRRACRRALEISRQYADTKPFASTFHSALQKVLQNVMLNTA
jgi:predicted O-linked N-acetylglucosamine transferase (SPINDLY family)